MEKREVRFVGILMLVVASAIALLAPETALAVAAAVIAPYGVLVAFYGRFYPKWSWNYLGYGAMLVGFLNWMPGDSTTVWTPQTAGLFFGGLGLLLIRRVLGLLHKRPKTI